MKCLFTPLMHELQFIRFISINSAFHAVCFDTKTYNWVQHHNYVLLDYKTYYCIGKYKKVVSTKGKDEPIFTSILLRITFTSCV